MDILYLVNDPKLRGRSHLRMQKNCGIQITKATDSYSFCWNPVSGVIIDLSSFLTLKISSLKELP